MAQRSAKSALVIDDCRINWGKATRVEGPEQIVIRSPLRIVRGVGSWTPRANARGFVDIAAIGDCVSLHRGWVCEVVTPRQQVNLARFTDHQLRIADETIERRAAIAQASLALRCACICWNHLP